MDDDAARDQQVLGEDEEKQPKAADGKTDQDEDQLSEEDFESGTIILARP